MKMSVNIVRSSKFTYYKWLIQKCRDWNIIIPIHTGMVLMLLLRYGLYFLFKKEIINIHMFIHYEYRALLISQFSAEYIVFNIEWYWWSCMRNKCIFSIQKGNNTYSYVPCDLSTHISLFFSYSFNISHIIAPVW